MGKDRQKSKRVIELRKRAEKILEKRIKELQSIGIDDIKKLVYELQVQQIELEMQNEDFRRTQTELEESRQRYVDLYDRTPVGFLTISLDDRVLEVNLAGANLLGEQRCDIVKKAFSSFIASEFQGRFSSHFKRVIEARTTQTCEIELVKKDGTPFYAVLDSVTVQNDTGKVHQIHTTITDITARKKAEEALRKANGELARRFNERTLELKSRQEELLRHKSELERVNKELLETNKAISVLARNIDKNRQETENTIANMINSNIMPIIKDLRKSKSVDGFHSGLDVLTTHLQSLTNDLIGDMNMLVSLTPTEMRVATMIKNGLTSQDIADKLYISLHTAKTHRRNIRRKLNVQNSGINLTSYLRSIMW
jgi:PAS domain S-box-containing protein